MSGPVPISCIIFYLSIIFEYYYIFDVLNYEQTGRCLKRSTSCTKRVSLSDGLFLLRLLYYFISRIIRLSSSFSFIIVIYVLQSRLSLGFLICCGVK